MNALKVILFSCFVQIFIFIRSTETQYVGLGNFYGFGSNLPNGQSNGFGNFFGNMPSLPNGSGRSISGFSDVSQDLKMGQNCQIGIQCKIGSGCSMGDNVRVSNYVQIDQGSSIGSNCQIMDYSRLGAYVTMGPNNSMNPYAQIKENANIGSGCIMGMYASIGPNARLEQNVYAGDYSQIGSNAVIGANSVIQPYAEVPDNAYVSPNEMVIRTPTTSQLYENCLPMNQIPQSDIDVAVDHGQPENNLNERVRQLMSSQKQKMESDCQRNAQSVDFKPFDLAVSLYIIRYDGLDNFIQNMEESNGAGGVFSFGKVYVNGRRVFGPGPGQAAGNDKHFVAGSPNKFLTPELENDMVELLALKKDSQRSNRVADDTFCKTVSEVQNKQKKVKCDQEVDVGSPRQNGPINGNSRPHTPNQGRGNGHSIHNLPPINPNYQPNKENQQPTQPNHVYSNSPTTPAKRDSEQTNANESNYSVNPNTNHPRPTQGTYQPTPDYPSNSYAPNNPISNSHETGRRPNSQYPYSPQFTSHNNQPNRSQNDHQNRPQTQTNSGNSPDCNKCNIQPDTSFGDNVELGNNLNIGKGTTVGNNCKIKDNVNVGDGVMIGRDSVVSENANIGNNCVSDDKSKVGANANIGLGSYVGKNCDVGANAFVGENSIVLDNAKVPDDGYVGQNDVVISTPTSADLYSSCAPIETVPQNMISQPDPNNNLRQVMRGQIAKVRLHCQQPSQELLDFATLASAKTMYLISLHGIPGFTENLQNIQNKARGNGNYDAKAYEKLMNEEHFIDNGQPSRIEPDVKGEMVVLMAIEQDFGRENRSPGNSFCQTFMDIARKQRQVKCDK